MGAPPPPARVPAARGHPRDRSVTPGCGSASPKTTPWGSGGLAARPPPSWDRTQFAKNIHFFPQTVPSGTDHGAGTGAARPAGATKPTPAITLSPSACSTHLTRHISLSTFGYPISPLPQAPKNHRFPHFILHKVPLPSPPAPAQQRPCHQRVPKSWGAPGVPTQQQLHNPKPGAVFIRAASSAALFNFICITNN